MNRLNIISATQLNYDFVERITNEAKLIVNDKGSVSLDYTKPFVIGFIFEQVSHRTKHSFLAACMQLNVNVIDFTQSYYEEIMLRGGNFNDFIDLISQLVSCLVVRSNKSDFIHQLNYRLSIPIINAGNGRDEHPTQALADIAYIKAKFNNISNLKIAVIGNIRDSRCAHSLNILLGLYNVEVLAVCPLELMMEEEIIEKTKKIGANIYWTADLSDTCDCDVLYFTGSLKEDFSSDAEYQQYYKWFDFPEHLVNKLKEHALIMHPLPRGFETDVFRKTHFDLNVAEQSKYILSTRISILNSIKIALFN